MCGRTTAVCFCGFENGSKEEKKRATKGEKVQTLMEGVETQSHNQGGVLLPLQEQRQPLPLRFITLTQAAETFETGK